MPDQPRSGTLREYVELARRHVVLLVLAPILVAAGAVAFSLTQAPRYEATAKLFLPRQNLAASLTGTTDPTASQPADRVAETQAELARTPAVASDALAASGTSDRSSLDLLSQSTVTPKPDADVLQFAVTDRQRTTAMRLANAYATSFAAYRRELNGQGYSRALSDVDQRLRELRRAGLEGSQLAANLQDKAQQLSTLLTLQRADGSVVTPASGAAQTQPRMLRNAALGLILGLVLAGVVALGREAMDTRLRSGDEVADLLGLPLLARVPAFTREQRRGSGLVLESDPRSAQAEAYRMLRASLEF